MARGPPLKVAQQLAVRVGVDELDLLDRRVEAEEVPRRVDEDLRVERVGWFDCGIVVALQLVEFISP